MMDLEEFKHWVDGGSLTALIIFVVDRLPYAASLVASVWVFLRVYDYIRYVRPKLIKDSNAHNNDPTNFQ